ncbi:ATP synthase gamma chain [Diplonema papillatum]|nr:ATP synthase gamma chain [Diplonema papillatum]
MSGKLRMYKDKLEGYKKFYSIISTIKRVALSKYQTGVARTKTRDYTLRYSKKAFDVVYAGKEELELCQEGTTTYIPVGTNRGSCGPLNSANYKYLNPIVEANGGSVRIVPIGKKAHDSVPKLFADQYRVSCLNDDKQAKSFVWANFVLETADVEKSDRIQVVFNRFVSAGQQVQSVYNLPSFEKFVVALSTLSDQGTEPTEGINNYRFANAVLDMNEEDVKDFYSFHRGLVVLNAVSENELSEHAARIIAVEGQLTNIAQLRDAAQMLFNKTRQGAITTALIEILSAMTAMADATKGSGITKNEFWATSA